MKVTHHNVSGAGNNCFFQALTAVLGFNEMCELIGCRNAANISTFDIRTKIAELINSEDTAIKELKLNLTMLVQSLAMEDGTTDRDIAENLSLPIEIVECFKEGGRNIAPCLAQKIMTSNCMVSQFEIEILNTLLKRRNLALIIITTRPGEQGNKQLVLNKIREQIQNMARNNLLSEIISYSILTTTNTHYRYIQIDGNTRFDADVLLQFMTSPIAEIDFKSDETPEVVIQTAGKGSKYIVKKTKTTTKSKSSKTKTSKVSSVKPKTTKPKTTIKK